MAQAAGMTIGMLARQAGVNVETVRFYQRRGLLPKPLRPLGGTRRYGAADLARLNFIRASQQLGFSLAEVVNLLKLDDGLHCREARELAEVKLRLVRSRLSDLRRMERALSQLVRQCTAARGNVRCPLIGALQHRASPSSIMQGTLGI